MKETKHLIEQFLNYKILNLGDYVLSVNKLVIIIIIIIVTKTILFFIKKAIYRVKKIKAVHNENLYTLNKIISYIIWIGSILIILNTIGIKITALLTGSAALLVGIGLGLQQTFNDFISGVILLFEGKTNIEDVVEVDNRILKLKNIGLRTTECIDRDGISVIIPNSKIVTDKVINWTHQEKKIRFKINIGVAYGSDVELVIKILENCAKEHNAIVNRDTVEARFIDFGKSSLNFELLFFSKTIFRIEKVKSDIRRIISKKFNDNNIVIPFPQMDVRIKNEKHINY